MDSIWVEIILIMFLIVLNGWLALSELALVSARKARLEQAANRGDTKASIALRLSGSPDHFLSTIQIGITFVGVLAGAFGGATIAEWIDKRIAVYPFLAPYAEAISVTAVVICITYLSLIIGELIPKRIALNNPEKIACSVAPAIQLLSRLAKPLVILLSGSTNLLLRVLGFKSSAEDVVTEEEIKFLIGKGTQAGAFQEFEQDTIERVFRLADRRVSVLMTHRTDIVWLNLNESQGETKRKIALHKYSSYPVAKDRIENIVGTVRSKDLLARMMEGKAFELKEVCQKPFYIYETTPAVKAMELLKKSQAHIAFVVDEYGTTIGLVTLGDILRSVFEDVENLNGSEKNIVEREDGSFLVPGSLPLDEFTDYMQIGRLSEDELAGMNTVGGFVMARLGTVPLEGHHFVWKGLRFEVIDMDGRRVDKVLVSKMSEQQ